MAPSAHNSPLNIHLCKLHVSAPGQLYIQAIFMELAVKLQPAMYMSIIVTQGLISSSAITPNTVVYIIQILAPQNNSTLDVINCF